MKKIFTKLIGVTLGLAMAVGVGVGVAATNRAATILDAETATMAASDNASSFPINGDPGIKCGASSKAGSMTITVGSGATSLRFYAAGWKGDTSKTVDVSVPDGVTVSPSSFNVVENADLTGSISSLTIASEAAYEQNLTLGNVTSNIVVTLTAHVASKNRFVVWGASYEVGSSFGTLHHITVRTPASKLSYEVGETFSSSGLALNGYDGANEASANSQVYSSGYSTNFDGHTFDNNDIGEQTVTVTYEGKETSYTINVGPAPDFVHTYDSNSIFNQTSANTSNTVTYTPTSGPEYITLGGYNWSGGPAMSLYNSQAGFYFGNNEEYQISSSKKYINKIAITTNADVSAKVQMTEGPVALSEATVVAPALSNSNRTLTYTFSGENPFFKFKTTAATYVNMTSIKVYLGSTVVEAEVDEVIASIKDGTYYTGQTLSASDFNVTVKWTAGKADTHPNDFTWKVNDVANGELEEGDNDVVVTYEGVDSDTFVVVGTTVHATGVTLAESTASLAIGETVPLHASLEPANAVDEITWTSDEESVATVNDNGVVTAVAAGSATITASANGHSDTCDITVIAANIVTLNYDAVSVEGGMTTTGGAQSFINNGLKVEIDNGATNSSNNDIRVYKNATITFTASDIRRIVFTCSDSNPITNFADAEGLNKATSTWTGSETSVSFTASVAQVRITQIVITYVPDDAFIFYNVAFNSLGGGDFDARKVSKGSLISPLPTPTKAKNEAQQKKYEFEGWYTVDNPANPVFEEENRFTETTPVNSDLTLYANYNVINYFIVTFETNGGTAIPSQEVDSGETVLMPANPEKAADASNTYTFEGWYTNIGLTDPFVPSTPVSSNMTLFAKYTAEAIDDPQIYVDYASSLATIHGNEKTSVQSGSDSITFATAGIESGTPISGVNIGSVVLSGAQGTNGTSSNVPKYFSTNTEMRVYKGNTFTFVSSTNITRIEFTFNAGSGLTANEGTYLDGVWTGEETSVTFVNSNESNTQIKITAIEVTYGKQTLSVDNVAMRFGATMPKEQWDQLASKWTISDYGVMFLKEDTMTGYGVSSVEAAFRANDPLKPVTIKHKGSGEAPYLDGDNYLFTIKVSIPSGYYGDVICAAPFIKVGDTYHFLEEKHVSVNDLATYYRANGGSSLSNDALDYLKTAH